MSNPPDLPAEMLDQVVDHLHDQKHALWNCCLVSKSWIPRARKHLFANIVFHTAKSLHSWRKTFSDHSASPAHYATDLFIDHHHVAAAAETEAGRWIKGFSRVEYLWIMGGHELLNRGPAVSFIPFHGLSLFLKSLRLTFVALPSPQVFDLILSFLLLEDLTVTATFADNGNGPNGSYSTPPMFSGSMELFLGDGMKPVANWLLSLPGGIHFRKLTLTWCREEDLLLTTALVEGCSSTLESLDIAHNVRFEPGYASVDLSKAVKLKDVVFRVKSRNVEWITMALQTITPEHQDLRQITIYGHFDFAVTKAVANIAQTVGERALRQWSGLDRVLARFWESRSIRPKVIWRAPTVKKRKMRDCVGCLLPVTTRRGLVDLVD